MGSAKVRRSDLPSASPAISAAKEQALKNAGVLINFSFKYLCNHDCAGKFCCTKHEGKYFLEVIGRIKNLSAMTVQELVSNRSQSLRAHPIKWPETSEKGFGIPKEDEIIETPYQFQIGANEHGRVHGFFISNTFYIVWLDKDHQLYP